MKGLDPLAGILLGTRVLEQQFNACSNGISITRSTFQFQSEKVIRTREIVADNPQNHGLFIVMGNFYMRMSNFDEAEAAYQKAIEIDPANVRYRMILGGYYNAVGEKEKALDAAMSINGKWIFVLSEKGEILIYSSAGKLEDTISVGKSVEGIKAGPREDVLLLTSGKAKSVQIITLDFIQQINVSGSPFKGKADAPVAVATFNDFE